MSIIARNEIRGFRMYLCRLWHNVDRIIIILLHFSESSGHEWGQSHDLNQKHHGGTAIYAAGIPLIIISTGGKTDSAIVQVAGQVVVLHSRNFFRMVGVLSIAFASNFALLDARCQAISPGFMNEKSCFTHQSFVPVSVEGLFVRNTNHFQRPTTWIRRASLLYPTDARHQRIRCAK
jgi:hypothetical protein